MDANELLKIQQTIGGDVTKTLSTIDVLSSLKAVNFFARGENVDPVVKAIADKEIEYLKLAMKAIAEQPALSMKFGNGFEGALAVSGLIKQKVGEHTYHELLMPYAGQIQNKEIQVLMKGGREVNFGDGGD